MSDDLKKLGTDAPRGKKEMVWGRYTGAIVITWLVLILLIVCNTDGFYFSTPVFGVLAVSLLLIALKLLGTQFQNRALKIVVATLFYIASLVVTPLFLKLSPLIINLAPLSSRESSRQFSAELALLVGIVPFLIILITIADLSKSEEARRPIKDTAKEAAKELGFQTEEVERDGPIIENGEFAGLKREKYKKYSLARPRALYGNWALLQRFPKQDSGLPNGFVVQAPDGTTDLLDRLRPLAEQYGDDFYEFERNGNIISVFCDEIDPATMRTLYALLSKLDA